MSTTPLHGDAPRIGGNEAPWGVPATHARRPDPASRPAEALDLVAALAELDGDPPELGENGLADALLAWLTPRPRNADTLTQARIVPLLGAAADLLSKATHMAPDVARLGALALEQELRMQRALAERRATLVMEARE